MDGFKADFVQYLRENNLLQKADLDKNDANINVQKYDDQLTDFLKDYKVDENETAHVTECKLTDTTLVIPETIFSKALRLSTFSVIFFVPHRINPKSKMI